MTVGVVIAGVAVIGVVLLLLRWRLASGEQQALRHYQNALDTLRTVSDRMESSRPSAAPTRRADEEPAQSSSRQPAPRAERTSSTRTPAYRVSGSPVSAPAPEALERNGSAGASRVSTSAATDRSPATRATAQTQDASTETVVGPGRSEPSVRSDSRLEQFAQPVIVFEENDAVMEPAGVSDSGTYSPARPTRSTRRALQRSSRPPSRVPSILGVLLVVVVIAVAVAVALGAASHPHKASPPVQSQTTAPPHNQSNTTSTSLTPSSTAPAVVQPDAATATVQGATYPAPNASYTVTLSSSGACWVYAKLASTGAVVWTGTLETGQAQTMNVTGQLVVELGHANTLSATLNGVPVQYPAQYQAVFTMTFNPTTV